jgi:hypothetical protein
MRVKEWLSMMKQDLQTETPEEREKLEYLLMALEEIVNCRSASDIDSGKTVKGAYQVLDNYAHKQRIGNYCCIPPSEAEKLLANYLNVGAAPLSPPPDNDSLVDFDDLL